MTTASSLPRGLRNRNPGNIRAGGETWQGQTGADEDGYCTFDEDRNGIRALAKLLVNYEKRYGLNTVRGLIDRWAPPNENATGAYVSHVAALLGVGADTPLDMADRATLCKLVAAIIHHENGEQPFNRNVIADGVARAFA